MGIPIHASVGFVHSLVSEIEPVESKIFYTALEGGLLFMALPLAFFLYAKTSRSTVATVHQPQIE
jgi:hypothetical protein